VQQAVYFTRSDAWTIEDEQCQKIGGGSAKPLCLPPSPVPVGFLRTASHRSACWSSWDRLSSFR